jgi:hypothetical protein
MIEDRRGDPAVVFSLNLATLQDDRLALNRKP